MLAVVAVALMLGLTLLMWDGNERLVAADAYEQAVASVLDFVTRRSAYLAATPLLGRARRGLEKDFRCFRKDRKSGLQNDPWLLYF